MDTGKALEIVHAMATELFKRHGEFVRAECPADAQEALNTVEDLIVNNFEEHEHADNPCVGNPKATDDVQYRVRWEIDIWAANPRAAAEKALATQRRLDSIATVFRCTGPDTIEHEIDLLPNRPASADPDPVHMEDGKWYFWDETWAARHGPYPDETTARVRLAAYVKWLERQ